MNPSSRTRLAILGTVSEIHRQPISYDLDCLQRVVSDVSPDLLCAEITTDAWEREDFSHASLEVREALTPVIASTDVVLIPISPSLERYTDFTPDSGWRRRLVRTFDRLLRWGQIQADNVQAVNGTWFETFCHTVCWFTEALWTAKDRAAWEKQNEEMVANIIHAVKRDGGRRVLVVVQCQRVHRLISLLRAHEDLLKLVEYQDL
ncbi:MAG: hypothetical protein DCC56_01770 [Anaerolineae bacterium]|nr:MAG: hypothetical protein DCC56_01770 [Anaerolineae bacterium]WKZ44765.1 MAG: hypothetical protein QY302_03115 [Anaerolineales bacterium]